MSEKIYIVKDINSLRYYPEIEILQTEQPELVSFKSKSIFAPRLNHFKSFRQKRTQSKNSPKLSSIQTMIKQRKENSVILPFISKEQGNISSYLPSVKSPKLFKDIPKVNHQYLKGRHRLKFDLKSLEFDCLVTKGYKLNNK